MSGKESPRDYRYWKNAVDLEAPELEAVLRRALVVDVAVETDDAGGIMWVFLELHHDGEPNRMVRLLAHGLHTEGWIWGEVALGTVTVG